MIKTDRPDEQYDRRTGAERNAHISRGLPFFDEGTMIWFIVFSKISM
jgi:hypothetical protein